MPSRGKRPEILEYCETLEERSREHGFDVIVRPARWPEPHKWPRYEWEFSCGHRATLGIPDLNRPPRGEAWCNDCQAWRVGVDCKEVKSGL